MSRKSVPRFCDDDMRKNKDLKCWSESERLRRVLGHDAEKCERFRMTSRSHSLMWHRNRLCIP
ncbi:hypothetical protein ELH97_08460 [Rhizobium leguminosarum]|nr:hypothetical protein ELI05_09090 [Rhizobium leguminosarum]TAX91959.1 hypothetical protein ELH97_08460 [Rhizobium leguminosarum]TAX96534.1 hypothetical protein ELH94_08380 [Rhizobium leguminosarum]TAY87835.1 hypothetical protein ELH83_08380 [Rhizobium leguminosarum]TAY98520.1 hypothetical protein ELH79_08540 [Rhizobium leguminosarum]